MVQLIRSTLGNFDQVGRASNSTEFAADGQEADIFYNDGVNWPDGNGSRAHDCFAGYGVSRLIPGRGLKGQRGVFAVGDAARSQAR